MASAMASSSPSKGANTSAEVLNAQSPPNIYSSTSPSNPDCQTGESMIQAIPENSYKEESNSAKRKCDDDGEDINTSILPLAKKAKADTYIVKLKLKLKPLEPARTDSNTTEATSNSTCHGSTERASSKRKQSVESCDRFQSKRKKLNGPLEPTTASGKSRKTGKASNATSERAKSSMPTSVEELVAEQDKLLTELGFKSARHMLKHFRAKTFAECFEKYNKQLKKSSAASAKPANRPGSSHQPSRAAADPTENPLSKTIVRDSNKSHSKTVKDTFDTQVNGPETRITRKLIGKSNTGVCGTSLTNDDGKICIKSAKTPSAEGVISTLPRQSVKDLPNDHTNASPNQPVIYSINKLTSKSTNKAVRILDVQESKTSPRPSFPSPTLSKKTILLQQSTQYQVKDLQGRKHTYVLDSAKNRIFYKGGKVIAIPAHLMTKEEKEAAQPKRMKSKIAQVSTSETPINAASKQRRVKLEALSRRHSLESVASGKPS